MVSVEPGKKSEKKKKAVKDGVKKKVKERLMKKSVTFAEETPEPRCVNFFRPLGFRLFYSFVFFVLFCLTLFLLSVDSLISEIRGQVDEQQKTADDSTPVSKELETLLAVRNGTRDQDSVLKPPPPNTSLTFKVRAKRGLFHQSAECLGIFDTTRTESFSDDYHNSSANDFTLKIQEEEHDDVVEGHSELLEKFGVKEKKRAPKEKTLPMEPTGMEIDGEWGESSNTLSLI